MDWMSNIKSSLTSASMMGDYERQRYGAQGGMQTTPITPKMPDVQPQQQQQPDYSQMFANMPQPVYNITNTYSSNYGAPTFNAPPPPPPVQPPAPPVITMPQMPAPQPVQIDPMPQQQQAAPQKPQEQPQQEAPPQKQEYHGNLGVTSGALQGAPSWAQQFAQSSIKIPW